MAIPKIEGAQRDFSAGEVDVTLKRGDELPAMKAGARQMSNWRILNSKACQNRPGRSAIFSEAGRIEQVLMSPGNIFYVVLGSGYLRVYNAAGANVFSTTMKGDGTTAIPWGPANFGAITLSIYQLSIYINYSAGAPQNIPQVLTWDGVSQNSTWTLSTYNEFITVGNQKRTPFYRISPPNITLLPSGQTGTINITFSAPVLVTGMIGTRMTFCGRQITIATVVSPTTGTATVDEQLFGTETLPFGSDPTGIFNIGDVVRGSISGSEGIVTAIHGTPTNTIVVQLIPPNITFVSTDVVVGPGGSLTMTGGATPGAPGAVSVWNDEVMNAFRGYPQSSSVDQGRLIFCNFPSVPSGIVWSTIGVFTDLFVEPSLAVSSPSSAIFEIAPGKSQVQYVTAGMESSEFVFCDNAIYFIPISVTNPLVPGSIAFTELSAQGSLPNVQPRRTEQTIVYMKSGGIGVGAVQAPGAYYRPYIVDNISDFHGHLFKGKTVNSIAIPSATVQFEELYIYIAFTDGTLAVGKYAMRNGLVEPGSDGKPSVGWLPWSGIGTVQWASALGSTVLLTTSYPFSSLTLVERLDDTQYLDGAVLVNNQPAPFAPPPGKGLLWWLAGGSVTLMDQGTRMMGTYQIDANGFIIPQNNAGENLASAQLVAGQAWTATLEPFVPDAQPGTDVHQRMFRRRVSRFKCYVSNSTGFLFARLFCTRQTRTSPPLGTIMNTRRIETWQQDDDPTQPPPLREEAPDWRPLGRSFDPRVAVIKDTPGPIIVHEIGLEASV